MRASRQPPPNLGEGRQWVKNNTERACGSFQEDSVFFQPSTRCILDKCLGKV